MSHAPYEGNGWSAYAMIKRRLADLDSPDPNGWTARELAAEYHRKPVTIEIMLRRLEENGHAMQTAEGGWIGP